MFSEVRVEGLETLDYLDNLTNRERFTEQGDAITFESEVSLQSQSLRSFWDIYLYHHSKKKNFYLFKTDKIYLSTPAKIAILDHEKKRTFVVRKDGLADAGKT